MEKGGRKGYKTDKNGRSSHTDIYINRMLTCSASGLTLEQHQT